MGMTGHVLLFPGQGAQVVGMGSGIVARSDRAAELFADAEKILGYDLLKLCVEGPESQLHATQYSQPALFVHSMACLEAKRRESPEWDSQLVAVAGLSLGEYSALVAAGAVDFEDALRLVDARGKAMQQAADQVASGMASVLGLDAAQVESLCQAARLPGQLLQPANWLCPGNTAISGHLESLVASEPMAQQMGAIKWIRLQVAGAFHTALMESAVQQLQAALRQTPFKQARVPIVSNVDGKPHQSPEEFRELLARQVASPVLWESSLRHLLSLSPDCFYEVGVGRVLAGTLKRIERKVVCHSLGDEPSA
jgi:[acyl-carrier-protein] S-malonyltransferase